MRIGRYIGIPKSTHTHTVNIFWQLLTEMTFKQDKLTSTPCIVVRKSAAKRDFTKLFVKEFWDTSKGKEDPLWR